MCRHFGSPFYLRVDKKNREAILWLKFEQESKTKTSVKRELIELLLFFSLLQQE